MQLKETQKNIIKRAGNFLFFGLLLLLIINPAAKAWMLKQLMAVGLFKAEIKNDTTVNGDSENNLAFNYHDASGHVRPADSLKGKVVFINFWATWCPPCIAEMPSMNKMYAQLKDDDRFVFLFINKDEDIAKARQFLQSKGYDIPLHTVSESVSSYLYTGTLPTTVVLNKKGEIVMKHEGMANYDNKSFIQQLKEQL